MSTALGTTIPAPLPPRLRTRPVFATCAALLGVEAVVALLLGWSVHGALLVGCGVVLVAFALPFCLGAVTLAGFGTGAAAAGIVVLEPGSLPLVLVGAAALATCCGLAPAWSLVEAWQAERTAPLDARPPSVRRRRADRVFAAFLVLSYPPAFAAFSVWFISWTATR